MSSKFVKKDDVRTKCTIYVSCVGFEPQTPRQKINPKTTTARVHRPGDTFSTAARAGVGFSQQQQQHCSAGGNGVWRG